MLANFIRPNAHDKFEANKKATVAGGSLLYMHPRERWFLAACCVGFSGDEKQS